MAASRVVVNRTLVAELDVVLADRPATVAESIADEARQIARAEAYRTGAYHDSIRVEETPTGAAVVADDDAAPYVEFGSATVRKVRPLGRAAESVAGDT